MMKYLRMNELPAESNGYYHAIWHFSFFLTSKIVNRCSLLGVQNKSAIANQQSAIANHFHFVFRCLSRRKRSFRRDSFPFRFAHGTPLRYVFGVQGGSSRIGMLTQPEELDESPSGPVAFSQTLGNKVYEFSNHLGNVLTTFSDRKIAIESISDIGYVDYYTSEILSSTDYYPFGFQMPGRVYEAERYRYGFNSMEKDDELKGSGNSYDFGARIYDPRVGRWLAVDILAAKYPDISPYVFVANNTLYYFDPDGKIIMVTLANGSTVEYKPGIQPSNNDAFLLKVHEAVTTVMKNDPNNTFQSLSASTETVIITKTSGENMFSSTPSGNELINETIHWNPNLGMTGIGNDGTPLTDAQAPSTSLLHEAGHAQRAIEVDTKEEMDSWKRDHVTIPGDVYTNTEEKRVIQNIETPYVRAANANNTTYKDGKFNIGEVQLVRTNHWGMSYTTKGINTIAPKDESKVISGLPKEEQLNCGGGGRKEMKTLLLYLPLVLMLTCCCNINNNQPSNDNDSDYQKYNGYMFQNDIRKSFIDTMGSKEPCIPLDFINHQSYKISRNKKDIPNRFLNFLKNYNKDDYRIGDSNDSDSISVTDVVITGKDVYNKQLEFLLINQDTLLLVYIQGGTGKHWVVDYLEMSDKITYYRYIVCNVTTVSELQNYLRKKDIKIEKQYISR